MKFKKLLSFILSAVMFLTGTSLLTINAGATLYSIKTYDAELDLSGYTDEQLKTIPLSVILDKLVYSDTSRNELTIGESIGENVSITDEDKVVWTRFFDEDGYEISNEYLVVDRSATVDLSSAKAYKDDNVYSFSVDIIIGSGKQLDPDNICYDTDVTITRASKPVLSFDYAPVYTKGTDGTRKELVTYSYIYDFTRNGENGKEIVNRCDASVFEEYANIYLGFDADVVDSITGAVYPDSEIKIRRLTRGDNTDVTAEILNQSMSEAEAGLFIETGYEGSYIDEDGVVHEYTNTTSIDEEFVLEAYVGGELLESKYIMYYSNPNYPLFSVQYTDKWGNVISSFSYSANIPSYVQGAETVRIQFNESNGNNGIHANQTIQAVAVGEYSTVDEVINNSTGSLYYDLPVGETTYFTVYYTDVADNGQTYDFVEKINLYAFYCEKDRYTGYYDEDKTYVYDGYDPYFYVYSVYDADGSYLDKYIMKYSDDSYYSYGYQTVFIREDADMSQLNLKINGIERDNVYDSVKSGIVDFSKPQDYTNQRVQYTVSTGTKERNYFVTILEQQTGGAKLYVNGPSERTVNLDDYFNNRHDIIVANIGDAELTGLNVEWSVAPKNVKLHDYWTVGGENNSTLYPMNTSNYKGKIRLIADGEGEISGQLKITADGQEPVYITVSGHAGNPRIVTNEELVSAVKYVPYSAIIATDNIYKWNDVSYKLMSGTLPEGVTLNQKTGEIYGTPQETGLFEFKVRAEFSETAFSPDEKTFKLIVDENTNRNVYTASDENYEIITHIGVQVEMEESDIETASADGIAVAEETTEDDTEYAFYLTPEKAEYDQLFTSNGEFGEFIDLWLNGKRLEEGTDYVKVEGSTKITIMSHVFDELEQDKPNTLAAEFRVDGDLEKDLKRTAQNFIIGSLDEGQIPSEPSYPTYPSDPSVPSIPSQPSKPSDPAADNDNKDDKDNESVKNVIEMIEKIADKDDAEEARKAYDKLSDAEKKLVTNYDKLIDAEDSFKEEAENDADEDTDDEETDDEEIDNDEIKGISFTGIVYSADGKKLSNADIEIHSEVQYTKTNANGVFEFDFVEYGKHELTITSADGGKAVKSFEITEGGKLRLSGNTLTVPADGALELSMVVNGNEIEFLGLGDVKPSTENADGDVEGVVTDDEGNPVTSVDFPIAVMAVVLIAAVASAVCTKRTRKSR